MLISLFWLERREGVLGRWSGPDAILEEGGECCGCLGPGKIEKRSYARCKQERADFWINTGEIFRLDSADRFQAEPVLYIREQTPWKDLTVASAENLIAVYCIKD